MSKIAVITSQANAQSLRIETAVRALEISIDSVGTLSYVNFLAAVAPLMLEVNKQTKNGNVAVLQRMSVVSLFGLAQSNGGLIVGAWSPNANSITHSVELSDYGAISLQDGESFEVNFTGFPTANNNTFTISLWALDHSEISTIHNVYEKAYFNANSPRELDIRDVKTLAIPTNSFDNLELTYKNGRRVRFTKEEILSLQRDGLGVRSVVTGVAGDASVHTQVNTIGSDILHNVSSAVTAKITTSDNTNVIMLKHASL